MEPSSSPESPGAGTWDPLAEELQALRRSAGQPSYAEIARRITERRLADGATPHAARVARTTVYDAFRTGRARVNLALVREIAESLGGSAEQVEAWTARCHEAPAAATPQPEPPAGPPEEPEPEEPKPREPEPLAARPAARRVVLLMVGCVALNLLGRVFVDFLHLPIYLDMVGTAIAAVALGPWRGALVGLVTNLVGAGDSGLGYTAFAVVNIAGALVWGYGVRRLGLGTTLPRFFLLNVLVAVTCTLVAVPLLLLFFDGTTGHGEDTITDSFLALTQTLAVAVSMSNLLISVGDKVISGFVALVAASMLPADLRRGLRLVMVGPPAEAGSAAAEPGSR